MINEIFAGLLKLQQFFVFIPMASLFFWGHACAVFFFTSVMYVVSQRSLRLAASHAISVLEREQNLENTVQDKVKNVLDYKVKDLEKEHQQKMLALSSKEEELKNKWTQAFNSWKVEATRDIAKKEQEIKSTHEIYMKNLTEVQAQKSKYDELLGGSWVLLHDYSTKGNYRWDHMYSLLAAKAQAHSCGSQWQYSAALDLDVDEWDAYSNYELRTSARKGAHRLFCGKSAGPESLIQQINDYKNSINNYGNSLPTIVNIRVWARKMPK